MSAHENGFGPLLGRRELDRQAEHRRDEHHCADAGDDAADGNWQLDGNVAMAVGIVSAPMPKNTPSRLSFAPRSPSLTSAASALVAPLSMPPPKPIRNMNALNEPFALGECHPFERRADDQRRADQHPSIAEPVDHRPKHSDPRESPAATGQ